MPVKKTILFDPRVPVKQGIDKASIEILTNILNQVKAICPVNKETFGGSLRNSYMVSYNAENGNVQMGHNDSSGGRSDEKILYTGKKHHGVVGSAEDYAPYVEFGTRSHVINVKNAKVLSDGKSFFGKSVNHPGTPSQPHLQPSVEIVINGLGVESALKTIKRIQNENMERLNVRK